MQRRAGPLAAMSALAALGAAEAVPGLATSLLSTSIASALSVSVTGLLAARVVGLLLSSALPMVVPRLGVLGRRRVQLWTCRTAAIASAGALLVAGVVSSIGGLVGLLCVTAVVGAPGQVLNRAVLVTTFDASARTRALSVLQLGVAAMQLALALALATGALSTWHRTLVVGGLGGLLAAVIGAIGLRQDDASAAPAGDDAPYDDRSWPEIFRSWQPTKSLPGLTAALLVVAMLLMPFDAMFAAYLHAEFALGLTDIGAAFVAVAAVSIGALAATAVVADGAMDRLTRHSSTALGLGAVVLGLGSIVTSRAAAIVLMAMGTALVSVLVPVLSGVAFGVVPPSQHRVLSAALAGVLPAGSVLGVVLMTAFANRHGPRSALVASAVVGLGVAVWWRIASRNVADDRERVRDLVEGGRHRTTVAAQGNAPLLECRGLDFSYGSVQVLFDVDFTVDDGEVVALLGTNGAGKSTLLKVISGIGLPQRGTVHLSGRDITYLDAEARVHAGVTQIAGGHAVFDSMTVIENLQSFGYTLGRDRRAIDEAIDRCLAAFPRLGERRTSLAATLSGGEQQMVGLSKALILNPRLLLVDELSLGLAPVVVEPLLDMIHRINSAGTAVVIVEQSATIALSLVDRACFMERGAMRFDGRAKDLLDRDDLLRAVFLEGAAKGTLE